MPSLAASFCPCPFLSQVLGLLQPLPATQRPRAVGRDPRGGGRPLTAGLSPPPTVLQLPDGRGPHCHLRLPAHPAGCAAGARTHHRHHRVPLRPGEHHLQVPGPRGALARGSLSGAVPRFPRELGPHGIARRWPGEHGFRRRRMRVPAGGWGSGIRARAGVLWAV